LHPAVYGVMLFSGLARFGNVGGWRVAEIAFLYGMVEISFGLMDMMFSAFDPDHFVGKIKQGELTTMLLRPAGLIVQIMGSHFLLRRLARAAQGALVLTLAVTQLDIVWTPAKIAYVPLVIAGQIMCYGALFVVGSTLIFWTQERVEAVNIVTYGSTEMTSYPMSIYPPWLRGVFTFIVPTIFMNYYPAVYFLGKPDVLGFPSFAPYIAPLVGAAMLAIASLGFSIGLRRYQGTGS
jgi:ABC-2 type transport system permease protein